MSLPPEPLAYEAIGRLGALRWAVTNSRRLVWRRGHRPAGGLRRMILYFAGAEVVGWEGFWSSGDRLVSFADLEEPRLCRADGQVIPLGRIELPRLTPTRWEVREWTEPVAGRRGRWTRLVPAPGNGKSYAAEAVRPGRRPPME